MLVTKITSRHQQLKVVTNTFHLRHPSPKSQKPITVKIHLNSSKFISGQNKNDFIKLRLSSIALSELTFFVFMLIGSIYNGHHETKLTLP